MPPDRLPVLIASLALCGSGAAMSWLLLDTSPYLFLPAIGLMSIGMMLGERATTAAPEQPPIPQPDPALQRDVVEDSAPAAMSVPAEEPAPAKVSDPVAVTAPVEVLEDKSQLTSTHLFDPNLLDPSAIDELLTLGGEDVLYEVAEAWLKSSSEQMSALKAAIKRGDAAGLKAAAHPLKSSSGNIGALHLQVMFSHLEHLGHIGSVEAAKPMIGELNHLWWEVSSALHEFLETRQTTPATVTPQQDGMLVLVIDDDATIRSLVRRALAPLGCCITEASSGEQGLACFAEQTPKLILLDVMMGSMDGFHTCRLLRSLPEGRDLPILMMTGLGDIHSIQQAYDTGATDFIIKPFNPHILQNRVRYMLRASRAFHELQESRQQVYTLAYYDEVTALPNRSQFMERLEQQVTQCRRDNGHFAVMFIDLDRFKRINDTLGHHIGDKLLRCVSDRLSEVIHADSTAPTLARFGGDEFVLLLPNISGRTEPVALAKKMLKALQRPFVIDGNELVISASVGMTLFPEDGQDTSALMKDADVAMYQIKEQGGNGFRYFTTPSGPHGRQQLELEADLRKALDRDEFEVFYQPKLDTRTWQVSGAEALIRWRHPTHGLVSPDQFIPLAEETGLIIPIGEWVLRTACRDSIPWFENQLITHRLAVNLSARQFTQQNLLQQVQDILDDTGLLAERLELEVTESMVMDNVDSAISTMRQLRDMGIELAIDDFGTGHSSLNYLRRFPINSLKIDRSFVRHLGTDDDEGNAITSMVIALGQALKLRVVAEGVENEQQLEILRDAGCDELQGYYISRPVSAADFEKFLLSHQLRKIA